MIKSIEYIPDILLDHNPVDYYEYSTDLCLINAICSNNNKLEIVAMFEYGFYWEMADKMLLGYFTEMNQIIVDHMIYPIENR